MKRSNIYKWVFASLLVVCALSGVSLFSIQVSLGISFLAFLSLLAIAGFAGGFIEWRTLGPHQVKKPPNRIKKAPGTRLMLLVSFLYSHSDIEKIFEPTIADWRKEYFEALMAHCLWKARWINVRYRYRF